MPAGNRNVITLVAPASPFNGPAFDQGLARLSAALPNIKINFLFSYAARQQGNSEFPFHLAGTDEERARFLNSALLDDKLVMMVRGGFGSSRLLNRLDWNEIVKARPRVLGFSDFTVILNHLADAGVVGFHGPGLTQLAYVDDDTMQEVALLIQGELNWPRCLYGSGLVDGRAQGKLMGGNLAMLCHLLGTPFAPQLKQAILFLEEVNEPAYRLDRMLTKLELAGVPQTIAGVAVGSLVGCQENANDQQERQQLVNMRLKSWGKPCVVNLPFGHNTCNRILPVGGWANIEDNCLQVGL